MHIFLFLPKIEIGGGIMGCLELYEGYEYKRILVDMSEKDGKKKKHF